MAKRRLNVGKMENRNLSVKYVAAESIILPKLADAKTIDKIQATGHGKKRNFGSYTSQRQSEKFGRLPTAKQY